MAITTNDIITIDDIHNGFTELVMNTILENAYDIDNVPMDGSYYCIQPDRLGSKASLPTPNAGLKGTGISAINLYNNLVALTTVLTRVGTFSYVRTYQINRTVHTQFTLSGKALFTESYIKTLSAVTNDDVVSGKVISSAGINNLFANLLAAWTNTEKHHNEITNNLCHSNCHSNCHSDCHVNSSCYK